MENETTTLTGNWSTQELEELATLCNRIGWRDIRVNAVSEEQAYRMRNAVYKLKLALADAGYEAR